MGKERAINGWYCGTRFFLVLRLSVNSDFLSWIFPRNQADVGRDIVSQENAHPLACLLREHALFVDVFYLVKTGGLTLSTGVITCVCMCIH